MFDRIRSKLQIAFRNRMAIAIFFLSLVMFVGASGFVIIEDYSPLEGLYMSAITVSTVGFGELRPLSDNGRAFTTLLIFMSFVTIAFAGHTLGQSLLEGVWSGKAARKRMKKKISSLKNHYIICGYGRVGASAAANFESSWVDFVVIESNENHVPLLEEKGYPFLVGDATHEAILIDAGIKKARGVMALLDSDPDNLFVVLTARELNPTLKIISRASDGATGKKIMRAGADDVISPLATAGRQIAREMLIATGRLSTKSDGNPNAPASLRWVPMSDAVKMINKPLKGWQKAHSGRVVGIRRKGEDMLMPSEETILYADDLVLVSEHAVSAFETPAVNPHETNCVVIIDDNPVILKLYARLFQKAGFTPITAESGSDGLALIKMRKPVAAVIDYHLPQTSGIELCRQVRKIPECGGIKLILFTADDRPKTRQEAIEAGIDNVVLKSPHAGEVINAVVKLLES